MIRRLFIIGLVLAAGCATQSTPPPPTPLPQTTTTPTAKPITLNTFETPSPTPQPSSPRPSTLCSHDTGVNLGNEADPNCYCPALFITCRNRACVSVKSGLDFYGPELGCLHAGYYLGRPMADVYCEQPHLAGDGDGLFCIGKPVIYLYPEKPTLVDVSVKTSGEIFVSDPVYPDGGWKQVLAHPDGTLLYQDQKYHELFYESTAPTIAQPQKGLTIPRNHLTASLTGFTAQLGLTGYEQLEFVDFWVPRLQALNAPYIYFSLIDPEVKKQIDDVTITPKPDTFIAFIAYFAPMDKPYEGPKLVLPEPPKRVGFTAVEWGGTIGPAITPGQLVSALSGIIH